LKLEHPFLQENIARRGFYMSASGAVWRRKMDEDFVGVEVGDG